MPPPPGRPPEMPLPHSITHDPGLKPPKQLHLDCKYGARAKRLGTCLAPPGGLFASYTVSRYPLPDWPCLVILLALGYEETPNPPQSHGYPVSTHRLVSFPSAWYLLVRISLSEPLWTRGCPWGSCTGFPPGEPTVSLGGGAGQARLGRLHRCPGQLALPRSLDSAALRPGLRARGGLPGSACFLCPRVSGHRAL